MNDTIDTVTVAIFANDSHVLLLQRSPAEYPGHGDKWELIGGHVLENELAREAAEREACEETGLSDVALTYAGFLPFTVSGQSAVNTIYVARLSGELPVTLSEEHQAHHWTPIALALQVPLACHHSEILRSIVQRFVLGGA